MAVDESNSRSAAPCEAGEARQAWTLAQWLEWLEASHPVEIELGLERVQAVVEALALGRPAAQVVTIAGTNGKGSTVAYLEQMLGDAGYRCGCYTSPHFLRYNERVRIAGEPVCDAALCGAFCRVEQARLEAAGRPTLTYFEYGTLAALVLFAEAGLDFALLEVGLGGRLDAVNVIDPDLAVITTVALDHEAWLGSDRESIGREKAGIFRSGVAAVYGEPSVPQSVMEVARQLGAPLAAFGRDYHLASVADAWHWQGVDREGQRREARSLPYPRLPLVNAATALQVWALLGLPWNEQALGHSIGQARLTGRMQQCSVAGVEVILDVAHNPHAAQHLAEQLEGLSAAPRTKVVLGMLADKDASGVIAALAPVVDHWVIGGLEQVARGCDAASLAALVRQQGITSVETCATVGDAYRLALAGSQAGDRILVCGSFYTVSEVLAQQSAEEAACS